MLDDVTTRPLRALVTGASGFLGRHLVAALAADGVAVTAVSRRPSPDADLATVRRIVGDFATLDVALLDGVDTVYHLAAITDTRVDDEALLDAVNVAAPLRLFDAALARGLPVVYASSIAAYGDAPAPQREDGPHRPLNAYGRSKLRLDQRAEDLARRREGVVVGLRLANVYGSGEAAKGPMASMVHQLIEQMRVGDPRLFADGEQRRDFVHVDDVVRALRRAACAGRAGVVNSGSGRAVTFNHLVEVIGRRLGVRRTPRYVENPRPEQYQTRVELDLDRARRWLGWAPRVSLDEGVGRLCRALGEATR